MVDREQLKSEFRARFGREPRVFSAPGRVNLIGEHTDYNDGFVLPMALDRRTFVAAAPRSDRVIDAFTKVLSARFRVDLDRPAERKPGEWGNYVEGMARSLLEQGVPVTGADLLVDSTVPLGAGVSASAALEISVGLALVALAGRPEYDRVQLALAGQRAEHEYVGTLSGIMDQYISALGRPGHALLIDCRTLEPTPIPLELAGSSVVVIDTGVKHDLAASEYNQRRAECQSAVAILAEQAPGLRALRDATPELLRANAERMPEVVGRRARHVVTENARTLAAVAALERGDLDEFGRLMVDSHRSLRDDYEVSAPELDATVDAALATPGVFGARMTGGGFGGSAVALVRNEALPELERNVRQAFRERFDSEPEIFASVACGGAREEA